MASVYDYHDGSEITQGLQGCYLCDEAIRVALSIAKKRDHAVVLEDDDGLWHIGPDGAVRPLTAQEQRDYL